MSLFQIIHDQSRPLCFVGNTKYNNMLYKYWQTQRESCLLSVEEVEKQPQSWIDQHQFICAVSNVKFKYEVVDRLKSFNPYYFSVVGQGSIVDEDKIGHGTFVQNYTVAICDNFQLGNHCTVGSFVNFSHDAHVADFCHISAYNFINYTNLGEGSLLAVRCTFLGKPGNCIDIAPHCNFMMTSMVRRSITHTGTYHSHTLKSNETSLTYKLL